MNTPNDADLRVAYGALAVANTPPFLVRKLRADATVQELARKFSGSTLLDALRSAVADEPTDLDRAVRPYVYLVALSMNPDIEVLKKSGEIVAANYPWFAYIRDFLLETFSNIIQVRMDANTQTISGNYLIRSQAPTGQQKIIISTR